MTSDLGRWRGILTELERRRAFSRLMGAPERLEKHRAGGKLNARQRVELLFDPGTFVEIGAFAAGLTEGGDNAAPADGLVAGFGLIDGRLALAGAEDFTVLAGSIGDAGADKRYRLTELAAQERIPLVFILEGAGHRLTNIHAGRGPNDLQGLADLSGKVPMVCLVMGPSAGHGALTAPLSDFVVMTEAASLFAAGPPLVKAAVGETVTKEQLGGPQVHIAVSCVAHNLVADDAAAIALGRRYLSYFPINAWEAPARQDGSDTDPRRLDEILSMIDPDPRIPFSMGEVLEHLVDTGSLLEVQPEFGASLIAALGRIGGHSVAIVANDPSVRAGAVDSDAADKAAHFLDVAGAFHLPAVFLTDTPGVMAGTAAEKSGVLRHAARMFVAQHRLKVPKLHVTLRKAFGFGSSIMAMNPFDNQTVSLAFPAITLGAMPAASGAAAANLDAAARAKAEAEQSGSAYHIADKMGFDDVIDPRDLRNALIRGLALTAGRRGPFEPVRTVGITP